MPSNPKNTFQISLNIQGTPRTGASTWATSRMRRKARRARTGGVLPARSHIAKMMVGLGISPGSEIQTRTSLIRLETRSHRTRKISAQGFSEPRSNSTHTIWTITRMTHLHSLEKPISNLATTRTKHLRISVTLTQTPNHKSRPQKESRSSVRVNSRLVLTRKMLVTILAPRRSRKTIRAQSRTKVTLIVHLKTKRTPSAKTLPNQASKDRPLWTPNNRFTVQTLRAYQKLTKVTQMRLAEPTSQLRFSR